MVNDSALKRLADEVAAIKRLLTYALLQNGMSQAAVAVALGVSQSSISRMFGDGGVTKRPSVAGRKVNAGVSDA